MSDVPVVDSSSPSPAGPQATVQCASCAAPIDPASAYFSATGDMVCARCNAASDIQATEGRAASAMIAIGYSTLLTALFSLFFNPMTLVSFLAVLEGSLAIISLLRGDWYRKRLGRRYYLVLSCAILGTFIGAWPYLLILLAIILAI